MQAFLEKMPDDLELNCSIDNYRTLPSPDAIDKLFEMETEARAESNTGAGTSSSAPVKRYRRQELDEEEKKQQLELVEEDE